VSEAGTSGPRSTCTFSWRGRAAQVAVEHRVAGFPQPLRMRRTRGSDLWSVSVDVPRGSRIEYRLLVRHGSHVDNILDPENPRIATGPAGEMSVCLAEGYEEPDWAMPHESVARGELVELQVPSEALGRDARVTVYTPAASGDNALPLLVMHDGSDYLRHSAFATVLDNLIGRGVMQPCIVAFSDPGDRLREYAADAAHARFVLDELVAALRERHPLRSGPEGLFVGGASFGAVASLAVASSAPGRIGGLLLQSASLRESVPDGVVAATSPFAPVMRFVAELRARPHRVTGRIYQSFGAFEPLAGPNRAVLPLLRELAGEVLTVETLDGHNWTAWRDQLADGLRWLLAGVAGVVHGGDAVAVEEGVLAS
jgi:enterochelin esterase-like enzyme